MGECRFAFCGWEHSNMELEFEGMESWILGILGKFMKSEGAIDSIFVMQYRLEHERGLMT